MLRALGILGEGGRWVGWGGDWVGGIGVGVVRFYIAPPDLLYFSLCFLVLPSLQLPPVGIPMLGSLVVVAGKGWW